MAFISECQHKVFLEILDVSIKRLNEQKVEDITSKTIATSLKEEKNLLQEIYTECHNKTQQLKKLITDYKLIQRKMQSEIRVGRNRIKKSKIN